MLIGRLSNVAGVMCVCMRCAEASGEGGPRESTLGHLRGERGGGAPMASCCLGHNSWLHALSQDI